MDGTNASIEPSPSLGWLPNDRLVLLLGAPRSGTSWVAKVFDSHASVLYRHEPDISLRTNDIPFIVEREDVPRHLEAARRYLAALVDVRSIKAVGSKPGFPKNYGTPWLMPLRDAAITGLRLAERVPPLRHIVQSVAVPDLLDGRARRDLRLVLKSVSSGGRARLFAEAVPGCRIIFLMRHPGGQVTSMLRGAELGKFEADGAAPDLLESSAGRRYAFTTQSYGALPLLDQLVWNWVLVNEKAMDDLEDLPHARTARHQDLAADPISGFADLFAFAGLSWTSQTETFIQRSTSGRKRAGYYDVVRNSSDTLDGWRSRLSQAEHERMRSILRETEIARRWPDLLE